LITGNPYVRDAKDMVNALALECVGIIARWEANRNIPQREVSDMQRGALAYHVASNLFRQVIKLPTWACGKLPANFSQQTDRKEVPWTPVLNLIGKMS
jgi:hypothetical protein